MRGLTKEYVLQRFLMYLLTIWLGTTLIFVIPRLAPGDPVSEMVGRLSLDSGYIENADELIASWKARFGLDAPIHVQYFRYWGNVFRLNFGYSLSHFPTEAWSMVRKALPWSLALLT